MARKKWISIPFPRSSGQGERKGSRNQSSQPGPADANGDSNGHGKRAPTELALQRSAHEVSQMAEEDIIADYNSPIHMCKLQTPSFVQAFANWEVY